MPKKKPFDEYYEEVCELLFDEYGYVFGELSNAKEVRKAYNNNLTPEMFIHEILERTN